MRETMFNRTKIKLMIADITDQPFEAFIYYATNDLKLGAGFGNAISVRGGPSIQRELEKLAPVETTKAVLSTAGELKAKHIIHAVGPKFNEEDTERKLRDTMLSSLKIAIENGIKQVAYPAMGAGFYAIPLDVCAKVMLETLYIFLHGNESLEEVVICVIDNREYIPFDVELNKYKTDTVSTEV